MTINVYKLSKYFLISCIFIKIIISCFGYLDETSKSLRFSFSFKKLSNNDESDLASRAYNLKMGRGLVKTIGIGDSISYKLSSNRPLLNIGIHFLYQNIYDKFLKLVESDIIGVNGKIDKTNTYYKTYAIIINYVTLIFYLLSIPFFMFLAKQIGIKNPSLLNLTAGFYLIFPSTLLYVGCIPLYENICLPISLIGIAYLLKLISGEAKNKILVFFIVSLMLTISVMLRSQGLIPLLLVLVVFGIYNVYYTWKKNLFVNKSCWNFILIFSIVFFTLQSFVFITNYKYFNSVFYTNRGDAFMWGHYDLAKGSWDGTVDLKESVGYKYERVIIPSFDTMTEVEQNKAQRKIANDWIVNNKAEEIKLSLKKLIIFFMPFNFDYMKFNLPMLVVHFGFFCFLIYSLRNYKELLHNKAIVFTLFWIFGVIIVNLVFFVEYRIKYFADPYMLIFAVFIFEKFFEYLKSKLLIRCKT